MIEKDFSCPVCLDVLKDPVILKCSHNICLSCANSLIALKENQVNSRQKRIISCPICRGGTYVPGVLAESLTSNIIVRNFLDQVRSSSDVSAPILCSQCSTTPASFDCLACDVSFCPECEEKHRENPLFARHKIVRTQKETRVRICQVHTRVEDLFCMEEKRYCCQECAADHPGHLLLTTDEARRALNSSVYRLRDLNREVLKSLTEMQAIIGKKLEFALSLEEKACNEINEAYEALKVRVDDAQNSALQRIGKHFTSPYREIASKVTTIRMIHEKLKECQRLEDDLLFYSRAPDLADIQVQVLNLPMSISLELPQFALINSYLTHSYVINKVELENSAITQLLYLSRGSRDYIVYNFETDKIDGKQLIGDDLIIHRWCGFAVLPDQSVFVTGGKESKDSGAKDLVFLFYPESGQTTRLPSMINGHSSHVCLYVERAVYVLGGKNQSNNTYSECEVYSIPDSLWTSIAPMALSRTCASGTHYNGKIYVFGGYQAQVDDSIESYTISTNSWQLLPLRLPEKVWQHSSCVISESQILIFGGESSNEEANTKSFILNLDSMSFTGAAQLPIQTNWLFFWLHVAQRGNALYAMSKEMQILKYAIGSNEWSNFK